MGDSMTTRATGRAFSWLYGRGWRLALAVLDTRHAAQVSGIESTFRVTTRSEYVRARTLGGERHVLRALIDELDGDEIVWDIGACVGTYACFAAQEASHVVAFEPEPTNRRRLLENLSENAASERWTVSPVAVARDDSSAYLRSQFIEAGGGHHFLTSDWAPGDLRVVTSSGDELVERGYPRPDIVKIDVQGAELATIEGLRTTFQSVEKVFVEVHEHSTDRHEPSPDDVEAALERLGFTLDPLGEPSTNRSGVYFLRGSRA